MGKKAKAKGRVTRRANPRISSAAPKPSIVDQTHPVEVEEKASPCEHFKEEEEARKKILLRIQSSLGAEDKCEDCRGESAVKKGGKSKGKTLDKRSKPKNSASSTVWVCLECNHLSCGGDIDSDLIPYGHARRHSKLEKHALAGRLDNPSVCFCFICSSLITIDMPELLKADIMREPEVEDKKRKENGNLSNLPVNGGYSVRGLTNLGNTCFFNSVMQNLLAMGKLRNYFLNLDEARGPLTMSLKKLFAETSGSYDVNPNQKNRITPSNLFGSVVSKAPQFKGYQQQDSHELLRYLLEGLSIEHFNFMKAEKTKSSEDLGTDSEENLAAATSTTFVDKIFSGRLSSTVCCTVCSHSSTVFEPFLDLSLPIPWKKKPPKAPPLPLSNKGKFCPRGRGRKLRDKRSPMASPKSVITEISNSASESSSVKPESEPEVGPFFGPSREDNSSWMDFIGSDLEPSIDSVHGPQKEEEEKEEQSAESQIEFQSDGCSGELKNPETSIIMHPYEPLGSEDAPKEETCSGELKNPETSIIMLPYEPLGSMNTPREEASSLEAEFEGFGDLFHEEEEESASVVKAETQTHEDFGVSRWGGNSSESNQEEIDGSDLPVSVGRCLSYFTSPELLSDEQAWECDNCSKILREESNGSESGRQNSMGSVDDGDSIAGHSQREEEEREEEIREKIKRDATKRILIDTAPCVLTVHLKRFSQDARGRLSKLNGHIAFQETLDLGPYMNSGDVKASPFYQLVGVVEHMGNMSGGHYVAYVRGERGHLKKRMQEEQASGWFYASDADVKEVSFAQVLQSEAYLLFYERV